MRSILSLCMLMGLVHAAQASEPVLVIFDANWTRGGGYFSMVDLGDLDRNPSIRLVDILASRYVGCGGGITAAARVGHRIFTTTWVAGDNRVCEFSWDAQLAKFQFNQALTQEPSNCCRFGLVSHPRSGALLYRDPSGSGLAPDRLMAVLPDSSGKISLQSAVRQRSSQSDPVFAQTIVESSPHDFLVSVSLGSSELKVEQLDDSMAAPPTPVSSLALPEAKEVRFVGQLPKQEGNPDTELVLVSLHKLIRVSMNTRTGVLQMRNRVSLPLNIDGVAIHPAGASIAVTSSSAYESNVRMRQMVIFDSKLNELYNSGQEEGRIYLGLQFMNQDHLLVSEAKDTAVRGVFTGALVLLKIVNRQGPPKEVARKAPMEPLRIFTGLPTGH